MSGGKFMEKTLELDQNIYSAEAVKLAAFICSPRAEIKIGKAPGGARVSVSAADAEKAAGEFLNEALNQQCRIDLSAKNSKIASIIVTKALLSAAGEKK